MGVRDQQKLAEEKLPGLLRYSTVAALLDVSKSTVKRWVAEGKLASVDLTGGLPRISKQEYLRFLHDVMGAAK